MTVPLKKKEKTKLPTIDNFSFKLKHFYLLLFQITSDFN